MTDLQQVTELLRSKGRGNDSLLAHITPREAQILKLLGGSGTVNPNTGLPEFDDSYSGYNPDTYTPSYQPNLDISQFETPTLTQNPGGDYSFELQPYNSYDYGGGSGGGKGNAYSAPTFDYSAPVAGGGGSSPIPNIGEQVATATAPLSSGASTMPSVDPGLTGAPGEEPGTFDKLGNFVRGNKDLLALGGSAALSLLNQRRAAAGANQQQRQIEKMAKPYQTMAAEYLNAGKSGSLLPSQMQQIQAQRAQTAQNLSSRGITSSTAAQQAEAAIQRQAQLFQQDLIQTGLQLSGISDQLTLQAINAGYQADQQAQQAANNFYQEIFRYLGSRGK